MNDGERTIFVESVRLKWKTLVIISLFQLSSNESHSMDLNLTQGQCFTKCYSLLSLISFNLDALIKADCSEMKSYAKLIITDFNILIDVLMQIKILESQRTQKSVLETAFPYIGEFFRFKL